MTANEIAVVRARIEREIEDLQNRLLSLDLQLRALDLEVAEP